MTEGGLKDHGEDQGKKRRVNLEANEEAIEQAHPYGDSDDLALLNKKG